MGRKCIVCGENSSRYSYFRFPVKEPLRRQWLEACHVEETNLNSLSRVCSKHFALHDLDTERCFPRTFLKENVVPRPSEKYRQSMMQQKAVQVHAETSQEAGPSAALLKQEVPLVNHLEKEQEAGPSFALIKRQITSENHPEMEREKTPPFIVREHETPAVAAPGTSPTSMYPRFVSQLTYSNFETPRRAKRNLELVQEAMIGQKVKIRKLQQQKRRLQRRIDTLKTLIEDLKDRRLISTNEADLLMENMPEPVKQVINRQLKAKNAKYDPDIRAFALTLHFYSAKAYDHIRKQFNNLLPHPRTIRQWYKAVNARPGFTAEVFEALKLRGSEKQVVVYLVMDEMSIRQRTEWQNGSYHGFVDLGTDWPTEEEARSALVLMAVCLNDHWKAPLAYFLIDSLDGEERANLVTTCLDMLNEANVDCHSITFDGAASNISMCKVFGASYELSDWRPYFLHPNTKEKVYTIYDPCHMVKLCRNTLVDKKIIFNSSGEKIEWSLIEKLCDVQNQEGLHAANKLTDRHINFQNNRMNVKLAVQVLSSSVSSGLRFCKTKGLAGFENIDATAEFCLKINNAFDILNSRNVFAKYKYNEPIKAQNIAFFENEVTEIISYLKGLNDNAGRLIIETNRKTGFLGLIISMENVLNLFRDLIESGHMTYLLTYKISQDHLETFFSAVRSRGGFNNNPSALQFKNAYRKLLVHHQITASGNCAILDATKILTVSSGTRSQTKDLICESTVEDFIVNEDHDYFSSVHNISDFVLDIVNYTYNRFCDKKGIEKNYLFRLCRFNKIL